MYSKEDVPQKTRRARQALHTVLLTVVVLMLAVLTVLLGIGLPGIVIGTVLLCVAGGWLMMCLPREYNRIVTGAKIINHANEVSLQTLFGMLKDVEIEPYGLPSVRVMKGARPGECIVYGPSPDGILVYIRKNRRGNRITLASSSMASMFEDEETQGPAAALALREYADDADETLRVLHCMIESHVRTGVPDSTYDPDDDPRDHAGLLYRVMCFIDWFDDRRLRGLLDLLLGLTCGVLFIGCTLLLTAFVSNEGMLEALSAVLLFVLLPAGGFLLVRGIVRLVRDRLIGR